MPILFIHLRREIHLYFHSSGSMYAHGLCNCQGNRRQLVRCSDMS